MPLDTLLLPHYSELLLPSNLEHSIHSKSHSPTKCPKRLCSAGTILLLFLLTKALINSFILSIIYENKYRIIPYHYPLKSKLFPCHEQIIYIFVGITNYISFKSQNMKKLSFIITFVFLSILFVQAQQAKYVFYFIGDGMGVNQVLGTEMYRSELTIGNICLFAVSSLHCEVRGRHSKQTNISDCK